MAVTRAYVQCPRHGSLETTGATFTVYICLHPFLGRGCQL